MTVSLISVNLPDFGIPKEQPTINAEIYKERLIKFRADLKNNQINSAVIYADREHFANMHYLTGFDPRDHCPPFREREPAPTQPVQH